MDLSDDHPLARMATNLGAPSPATRPINGSHEIRSVLQPDGPYVHLGDMCGMLMHLADQAGADPVNGGDNAARYLRNLAGVFAKPLGVSGR